MRVCAYCFSFGLRVDVNVSRRLRADLADGGVFWVIVGLVYRELVGVDEFCEGVDG